jgi:3-mercaptopyruvate sulfurtransferase SseA
MPWPDKYCWETRSAAIDESPSAVIIDQKLSDRFSHAVRGLREQLSVVRNNRGHVPSSKYGKTAGKYKS